LSNVVQLKETTSVTVTFELSREDAALVNKFLAINQHTRNTHGPMSWDKLVQMWLEDVAAAVRDNQTWQGGHAALVLSEHGHRT
jgi:hypothetical protein